MTERRRTRWPVLAAAAAGLLALGVAIGALLWRAEAPPPQPATIAANAPRDAAGSGGMDHSAMGHGAPAGTAAGAAADPPMVMLTAEMVQRAGIRTAPAVAGSTTGRLRLPGVIQSNAYKAVPVTALVPGRVTQVRAQLGERVRRGQVLATIYSPEFARAQTEFVTLNAEYSAHGQELGRTRRLAAIGASSRQELEMVEAAHAKVETELEATRSRLLLLGFTDAQLQQLLTDRKIAAEATVTAPAAGVITERQANPGQNIDPATPLFTVVDLGTVWVIADLYERDFGSVRVGSAVRVTSSAYPGLVVDATVSYIDPQLQSETRTAKVRIEIPNPGGQLRLGTFVDVDVEAATPIGGVLVPRTAVQTIGDRRVVFIADAAQPGHYLEREVRTAEADGNRVAVTSGLMPGELVVTEGAFFLRAERERGAPGAATHQH